MRMYRGDVPLQELRPGHHHGGDPPRRRDPDHDHQRPQPEETRDRAMTVAAEPPPEAPSSVKRRDPKVTPPEAGWLVKLGVLLIVILWTIPSLGLLVDSFRPASDETSHRVVDRPLQSVHHRVDAGQLQARAGTGGMFDAFVNSLIVTIPSTVIPITLAAFAAYAFAWIKFRGQGLSVRDGRRPAGGPPPDVLGSPAPGLSSRRADRVVPRDLAGPHRFRAAARRSTSSTTTSPSSPRTSSSRPISMGPRRSPPSPGWSSPCRFRPWRRLPSSSSSGCGTTSWWRWSFLGLSEDVACSPSSWRHRSGSRGEAFHLLTAAAFVSMLVPHDRVPLLQRFFVRGLLAGSVKG